MPLSLVLSLFLTLSHSSLTHSHSHSLTNSLSHTLSLLGVDLDNSNSMTFSVIGVASSMGWDPQVVRSELMALQLNDHASSHAPRGTRGGGSRRSTVLVEMGELAFHVRSPGDLTTGEREEVVQMLRGKVVEQERRELEKLHLLHTVLRAVAAQQSHDDNDNQEAKVTSSSISNTSSTGRGGSPEMILRDVIGRYFSEAGLRADDLCERGIGIATPTTTTTTTAAAAAMTLNPPPLSQEEEERVAYDVASLASRFSDQEDFTGRAVARIFQGIASPKFPALVWGVQRAFWRKYLHIDFNTLCRLATTKLLQIR